MRSGLLCSVVLGLALGSAHAGPSTAQVADDVPADVVQTELGLSGQPAYGGSGCPQGTVSVVVSDDATAVSVVFDEFYAETTAWKKSARASCTVAIPLHVPQGKAVSVVERGVRGYAEIPKNGKGSLATELSFAGRRGPRRTTRFKGGFEDDFLVTDDLQFGSLISAECGQDEILRMTTSLRVRKRRAQDSDAYMVLDDGWDGPIAYDLQWRDCL